MSRIITIQVDSELFKNFPDKIFFYRFSYGKEFGKFEKAKRLLKNAYKQILKKSNIITECKHIELFLPEKGFELFPENICWLYDDILKDLTRSFRSAIDNQANYEKYESDYNKYIAEDNLLENMTNQLIYIIEIHKNAEMTKKEWVNYGKFIGEYKFLTQTQWKMTKHILPLYNKYYRWIKGVRPLSKMEIIENEIERLKINKNRNCSNYLLEFFILTDFGQQYCFYKYRWRPLFEVIDDLVWQISYTKKRIKKAEKVETHEDDGYVTTVSYTKEMKRNFIIASLNNELREYEIELSDIKKEYPNVNI